MAAADATLWRICRAAFADLSGAGARLWGGRWNAPGQAMVYCADSPALAALEVRVHLDLPFDLLPDDYQLVSVLVPEAVQAAQERVDALPPDPSVFGDAWLSERRSALLSVPSVIVPECRNVLINPAHPDADGIRIAAARPFRFDQRLF